MRHINKYLKDYFLSHKDEWIDKSTLELYGNTYGGKLRGDISLLRKNGLTIISKKGLGYKLSTDKVEVAKYAMKERAKAKDLWELYNEWVGVVC